MTGTQKLSPAAQKFADEERAKKPMKETDDDKAVRENAFRASGEELLGYIERQERLIDEIKDRQSDRKQVKAEAKGRGYDTAVIDMIIRERALDEPAKKRLETRQGVLDTYRAALGMDD